MSDKAMTRNEAIDLMRDVYLTKAQREAYEYILSLALPEDAEPVDPPSCPVCESGMFYKKCSDCGYENPQADAEPVKPLFHIQFNDYKPHIYMNGTIDSMENGKVSCFPFNETLYTHPPKQNAERVALLENITYAMAREDISEDDWILYSDIRAYLKGGA
jgi:hypothetical protein